MTMLFHNEFLHCHNFYSSFKVAKLSSCLFKTFSTSVANIQYLSIFVNLFTSHYFQVSQKDDHIMALCLCSTISNKFQINNFFLLWFVIHNIHFHFQNSLSIGILFSYHDLHYHYIPVNQNWIQ